MVKTQREREKKKKQCNNNNKKKANKELRTVKRKSRIMGCRLIQIRSIRRERERERRKLYCARLSQ